MGQVSGSVKRGYGVARNLDDFKTTASNGRRTFKGLSLNKCLLPPYNYQTLFDTGIQKAEYG
jgi:hypothetical protein